MFKNVVDNLKKMFIAPAITSETAKWYEVPCKFKEGRRVRVNERSGFSRGSEGVIRFIEPRGVIWVRRDRSGSDVMFSPHEINIIDEQK